MEMLAFPNIKTHRNGQIGKKGCRQKKGMSGKLADIDVLVRHVADMLPTFPTKLTKGRSCELVYNFPIKAPFLVLHVDAYSAGAHSGFEDPMFTSSGAAVCALLVHLNLSLVPMR
jgi:hypothetical protein